MTDQPTPADLSWCPFCDHNRCRLHQREVKQMPDGDFRVVCGCGAIGPPFRTGPEAVQAWPCKPQPDAELQQAMAQIEKQARDGGGSADSSYCRVALSCIADAAARWK